MAENEGNARLIDYYARRAGEYERLYAKPERQADLAKLQEICRQTFAGQAVLEIACGTGYWTQFISQTAKSITATDINDEVLEIARSKTYGCPVYFRKTDAFALAFLPDQFTAGLAMHWWSHLQKSEIKIFLARFHRQFPPGARLAFMDNQFVPGSSTPISRTDLAGNTYQLRELADGSRYEILKNFPEAGEIREAVGDAAAEFSRVELPHYWLVSYRLV